jgi:hypothetical protein
MGKVTWGSKAADIDNAEEFESNFTPYDGPMPPRGVYRLKLRKAEKKVFKSGNAGIELLLEIAEPGSSSKSKYNGCPTWFYLVDTDSGAPNIKNFMRAIGGTGRHWVNTHVETDDRNREIVTKWGNIVASGLSVRAELKRGRNNEDEARAEIQRFLPKGEEPEPSDDGEPSASVDDAPF